MEIKKIYIGNEKEAFIEKRFESNMNIIFSDDNNKGKTIVLQSIMYALGNKPIFPSSFKYKQYYYIVVFSINNNEYELMRKENSFTLKSSKGINIFDNSSELKRYFSRNIKDLPVIIKDGYSKLVDFELVIQMFFTPQDKRTSSNIIDSNYYKKKDFLNMLLNLGGLGNKSPESSIDELKKKLKELREEEKQLRKKSKTIKKLNNESSFINLSTDFDSFENRIKEIDKIKEEMVTSKKLINRLITRKIKNESTLKELRSLNQVLSTSEISCNDCGSKSISFKSADKEVSFDITNVDMRRNILYSIQDKIQSYSEEVLKERANYNEIQLRFKELFKLEEVTLENLLLFKDEIVSDYDLDKEIIDVKSKITETKDEIEVAKIKEDKNQDKEKNFINGIASEMNRFYKLIDVNGNLVFNDIFSSPGTQYSGSENAEYFICRTLAILKATNHDYPLILDGFRENEISTNKEKIIVDIFRGLSNQIIISATVKEEELQKYHSYGEEKGINVIDYSVNEDSKILQKSYLGEFTEKINDFYVVMNYEG